MDEKTFLSISRELAANAKAPNPQAMANIAAYWAEAEKRLAALEKTDPVQVAE